MAAADYRLMTEATGQRIAAALEALHLATVTGVKGNAEQNYRHGDVNLTPANIGAVATFDIIDVTHGGTGATNAADARMNLEAAAVITLNQSTRADIWEEIKKIPVAKAGLIFMWDSVCSILTRGALTKWLYGFAVRTNSNNVAIVAMEDSAMYTWSVMGFNTDSYTVGTIIKYTGTAI